ncbi:unnamed protein product, partial [Ixodes pacificus]
MDEGKPSTSLALRRQRPAPLRPTDEQWKKFLDDAQASNLRPAFFSLVGGYAESYVPTAAKYKSALLCTLFKDCVAPSWEEVSEECDKLASNIRVEREVLHLIEKETRAQSSCRKWFSFRAGRVTASCAKAACSTSIEDPSPSLVQRICYLSKHIFTTVATTWGIDNEPRARAQYVEAMTSRHSNFECCDSGVHISFDHQFLAATPDGVVSCDCCGAGVLEVKCPYSLRECTIIELTSWNSSSITLPDGDALQLKRKHAHFWQIQMQMFVCQVKYSDYVVWTTTKIFIERIFLDNDFCARMFLKSTHFFKRVLLPELRYRYTSQPVQKQTYENGGNEDVYCLCDEPEYGKMVMCDNPQCIRKWYHFACIGMKKAPQGQWLC